jgi:hypothetical protein
VCCFSSIVAEHRGWFGWEGGEWFSVETLEESAAQTSRPGPMLEAISSGWVAGGEQPNDEVVNVRGDS